MLLPANAAGRAKDMLLARLQVGCLGGPSSHYRNDKACCEARRIVVWEKGGCQLVVVSVGR
jgi:hypothetical protein